MPTDTEQPARKRRPEHEWHIQIRQRNEALREALNDWLGDGNVRRLKKAVGFVVAPAFAPPPSPRLTHETERLLASVTRALLAPAVPKGTLREQRALRIALLGRMA